jgi:hypothetical protein
MTDAPERTSERVYRELLEANNCDCDKCKSHSREVANEVAALEQERDELYGRVIQLECTCLPYAKPGDGMCERCALLAVYENRRALTEGKNMSHAPVGKPVVFGACPRCSTDEQYVIHADHECPAEGKNDGS